MTMTVPNDGEELAVQKYLDETLTLRLYSNNIIPGETDTITTYNEVVGGGYVAKSLVSGNWIITPGNPTIAVYPAQDFLFTGVTVVPAVIYGYFVTDALNVLRWAERFPEGVLPFVPLYSSLVRITPRFIAS